MPSLDMQYIADLVLQAQEGDSNAFAELFAATHQKQYAFALRDLRDEFLAQQALQNAYVLALTQISRLRDPALFVVWLNQLTLRACFSLHTQSESAFSENSLIEISGSMYSVRQIMTLPFSEAQTILLCRFYGMKTRDVAALLEIPRGDIRRHIENGCRRLRHLAAEKGGEHA